MLFSIFALEIYTRTFLDFFQTKKKERGIAVDMLIMSLEEK
jgi:hypothetical protein